MDQSDHLILPEYFPFQIQCDDLLPTGMDVKHKNESESPILLWYILPLIQRSSRPIQHA